MVQTFLLDTITEQGTVRTETTDVKCFTSQRLVFHAEWTHLIWTIGMLLNALHWESCCQVSPAAESSGGKGRFSFGRQQAF